MRALGLGWLMVAGIVACGDDAAGSERVASDGAVVATVLDASQRDAGSDASNDARVLGIDAGADAGPVPNVSARHACLAYVDAVCERGARCSVAQAVDGCRYKHLFCPDLLFATGSTHTPASLSACAHEWKTHSCELLLTGQGPACALPGTRAVGEACSYPSQCATQSCSGTDITCGACLARVPPGGACSYPQSCEFGYVCTTSKCVPPSEYKGPDVAFLDEECVAGQYCSEGLECSADASSSTGRRCLRKAPGTSCVGDDCPDDSFCDWGTRVCKKLPVAGEPCASKRGLRDESCAAGLTCGTGSTCVPRAALGARCDSFNDCLEGLVCTTGPTPTRDICKRSREEGESCTDALDLCVDGAECVAGSCQALATLGTFERACMP